MRTDALMCKMKCVCSALSIRQHTSAYVSIRQHTSAYVITHMRTDALTLKMKKMKDLTYKIGAKKKGGERLTLSMNALDRVCSASVCHTLLVFAYSIRQHTSAYVCNTSASVAPLYATPSLSLPTDRERERKRERERERER
jgi:hypothetical protein